MNLRRQLRVCLLFILLLGSTTRCADNNDAGNGNAADGAPTISDSVTTPVEGIPTDEVCDENIYPQTDIDYIGEQPYESIFADPGMFFVEQGSSQCGPTAFYMIFKYFGDHMHECPYFYDSSECDECLDLNEEIPREGVDELLSDSKVSQWIHVDLFGTGCNELKRKLFEGIYYLADDDCIPFFHAVDPIAEDDSCDELGYNPDGCNDVENYEKRRTLDYIAGKYLANNIPVIIHLSRTQFLRSGHYVVLIGYRPSLREVYLVDPNSDNAGEALLTADYDEFITSKSWSGSIDAYWDGSWVGFAPPELP
jgi:Peptidase_C39 like family